MQQEQSLQHNIQLEEMLPCSLGKINNFKKLLDIELFYSYTSAFQQQTMWTDLESVCTDCPGKVVQSAIGYRLVDVNY